MGNKIVTKGPEICADQDEGKKKRDYVFGGFCVTGCAGFSQRISKLSKTKLGGQEKWLRM
jgi:hypothetical protein